MPDLAGQQLGNYRLVRLLGRGGYAEVYLGEHIRLNTQAAIKVLHTRLATDEEVNSFQNEGRIVARLVHPHIIRVFDFDVENGIPFMVMDYAPNGNLRKRHPRGEQLPLITILPYVQQAASALQYAHDQHFVHRDIKPENMLLGRNDEVLLSDFGTALVAQSTALQTTPEEVIGTVSYMAPEQFQGKARPASDQYALAVVVYEWLSGQLPFRGSGTEVAIQHSLAPVPSLREKVPTILPQVEQAIMRALAKDYHQRFPRVQDFANALEQASKIDISFYSDTTVAVPALTPYAPPGTEAPRFNAQPAPVAPTQAVIRPSPLTMDTATAEVVHTSAPESPLPAAQSVRPAHTALTPPRQFAPTSPPAYQQEPLERRKSRMGLLVLLFLALLVLIGGSILWFVIPHLSPLSHSARPSAGYPNVAGSYTGTLQNTRANVQVSMSLSIQQDQGKIHGYFTVGQPLVGSNPFTGTVDTTRHIQFTVESYHGNAPLFFEGTVQTDGSMSGTYCSLGQDGQCSSQAGGGGTWQVSRKSGAALTPVRTVSATDNAKSTPEKKRKKHH
jgi:serine/threonine protein kinase